MVWLYFCSLKRLLSILLTELNIKRYAFQTLPGKNVWKKKDGFISFFSILCIEHLYFIINGFIF